MKHKEKMTDREYRYGYIAGTIMGYLTIFNSLIIFGLMMIFFAWSYLILVLGMLFNLLIDSKILRFYTRKAEKKKNEC